MSRTPVEHSGAELLSRYNRFYNFAARKKCFNCPREGAEIIRAHAISESKVLSRLAESGNVISVKPGQRGNEIVSIFQTVGTGQVSSFAGMCGEHDREMFNILDNEDYSYPNPSYEFAAMFRTIARSAWFADMEYNAKSLLIKWVDDRDIASIRKYAPATKIYENMYNSWLKRREEVGHLITRFKDIRDRLNTITEGRAKEDSIATVAIHLPHEYPIAAVGTWNLICPCHERESKDYPIVTYNILPQNGETYAIFSTFKEYHDCLSQSIESMGHMGLADNRRLLTQLLARTYPEALAIRPSYWKSLPSATKERFISLYKHYLSGKDPIDVREDLSLSIFRLPDEL